ncbi:uncharacterized protein [Physcomitrium patens]|uniref:uncharacterized protein n=1 Tax=Physcomitrium patens TaxID=3218 RepID=UPI003CCD4CBE
MGQDIKVQLSFEELQGEKLNAEFLSYKEVEHISSASKMLRHGYGGLRIESLRSFEDGQLLRTASQLQQAQCAFGNLRSQLEHDKDHVTFAEKVSQDQQSENAREKTLSRHHIKSSAEFFMHYITPIATETPFWNSFSESIVTLGGEGRQLALTITKHHGHWSPQPRPPAPTSNPTQPEISACTIAAASLAKLFAPRCSVGVCKSRVRSGLRALNLSLSLFPMAMASSASSLSIPLKPSEAFGVKGSLRDGVHFVEGYTFIYVASHCVIEKNIRDLRAQGRFLTGSPSMCGISAIVVSPDDRTLAVAEIAKLQDVNSSYSSSSVAAASPVISVYSAAKLSKKQSLISASAGSHEYISLSYTCDGKHLAALGGPPEWLLQLWHVRKTKVLCSIKTVTLNSTGAYQVRCCPVDKNWFTVCGDGFAKTYKMVDTDLRQVSTDYTNQEGRKVFCHSWIPRSAVKSAEDEETKAKGGKGLNGKITVVKKANKEMKLKGNEVVKCGCVYALDSGELLYVNHGEVIAKIPMQESGDEVCIVQTILPYSKGFICGENGKVSVYDYDKDHKTYKKVRSIKVEETNARVHGLALSSEEDVLICLLSTNRLIHLCFDEIDTMSADTVSKKVQAQQSYHQAFITGMDTCLLKPFVVTCSKDNSVRVWNFEDRSCEILKFFPSEALSVSIHPNGLYLLVGCMDCLHLLNMVIDDLSLWKEFPSVKGCTDCAFSRGGQCFAAATGNVIHVISTYTGQIIGHLRGHTNKVRSIWWAYDDFSIVTSGMDGAIYEWSLKTWERSREYVTEGCPQTCAIGTKSSNRFFSTTSNCKLRELDSVEVFHVESFNLNYILGYVLLAWTTLQSHVQTL